MRKTIILTFCISILLIASNCTTSQINNNCNSTYTRKGSNQGVVNSVSYNNGIYTGEGDYKSYGNEVATITISNGSVTEVDFKRLDCSGNTLFSKNSKELQPGNQRRQLLKEDLSTNVDLLVADVIKKQSYDISIPTKDKELLLNWKLAVKRALEQAKK